MGGRTAPGLAPDSHQSHDNSAIVSAIKLKGATVDIQCIRSPSDGSGNGSSGHSLSAHAGSFRIVSAQIRALKTIISALIFRAIYCVSTSTQFCWTHLSRCVGRWLCMHACARLGCNAMQPSLDRFVNTMLVIAGLRFQLSKKIGTSSLSPVVLARLDWALASGCVERCGLLSCCMRLAHRIKEL